MNAPPLSAITTLLELLAREASAAEFDEPVRQAQQQGASPQTLAELEHATQVALQVRELLSHRRRREAELSALFDTASDLAALRDVDAVLRAIVRRARTLLGADLTYLTLHDPDRGDTYMRVTDGSISARFQRLRLPMGAGLGGLVAQSATPYVTSDYLADQRFRHTTAIDAGVQEEGLVAILGVPLRLGESVLGVLFAANRSPRPFSRREVALLVSLSAHAAVAIDSARMLSETRAALAELSEANQTARAHSAAVERAAAAHDRMAALVLQGGGVEQVAAAVADVLAGALLVLDLSGRVLASVGQVTAPGAEQVRAAVAACRAAGRGVRRDGPRWWAAVVAGDDDLGAVLWQPAGDVADADARILERAAMVIALLLLFDRTVAEAEARVRGELLDDLVSGAVDDPEQLRVRAQRLGVEVASDYVLVVADLAAGEQQRCRFWAGAYAQARQGLAVIRGAQLVMLLPGAVPTAAAQAVVTELGQVLGRPVTAGAAGPTTGLDGLATAFTEARQVVAALVALGRRGQGASADDLGYVGLLLGSGSGGVHRFVADTLGPVRDYDQRRGTELLRTLEIYFGCDGRPARAAEQLHVHVNTVNQRLERIGTLLGQGWQHPERALEIQLALRLQRLSCPPPSSDGRS